QLVAEGFGRGYQPGLFKRTARVVRRQDAVIHKHPQVGFARAKTMRAQSTGELFDESLDLSFHDGSRSQVIAGGIVDNPACPSSLPTMTLQITHLEDGFARRVPPKLPQSVLSPYTSCISQAEVNMSTGTVFTNNRTQAVRLPADTRFPPNVKRVDVRVVGSER